jgi:hypothetical protein
VPVSNDHPPAGVQLFARRCWNHNADGTPYPRGKSDPQPDPGFSPQGDVRYFQGDIGTHGLHVVFIVDSDNAYQTVPVDELDSEQLQVILPGRQKNVGEAYGRSFEEPLIALAVPDKLMVDNLGTPASASHAAETAAVAPATASIPISASRPATGGPAIAVALGVMLVGGLATLAYTTARIVWHSVPRL